MIRILAFFLLFLMIFACAGGTGKLKKRASGSKSHGLQKKNIEKGPSRGLSRGLRQKRATPASRFSFSHGKILLPSIIHPKDQSEMVLVSAGGNPDSRNRLAHESHPARGLPAFYIDRLEITVEQYKRFDPSYDEKPYTDGKKCPACPAMGIDWKHARRYCLWAGKRLPGEREWETAAGGGASSRLPWGNDFLPDRANILGDDDGYARAAPVGSFPLGASPYGALDMIGNVWEWVERPPGKVSEKEETNRRIVKGGGWSSGLETATITFRNFVDPELKNPAFGVRCVKPVGGKLDVQAPSS
ncbi:MAG: formylglycine-generating enzyme family protein [Nitrospinales bacterium]